MRLLTNPLRACLKIRFLGSTGDSPVPLGNLPSGTTRASVLDEWRGFVGCRTSFRRAGRPAGQAGGLCYPCFRQGLNKKRRQRAGFTFAEVLAAMVFMAILIPVVIQGLSLSNRAAVIAERKAIATRLANNVLTDSVVTGSWKLSNPGGVFEEPWYEGYRWEIAGTNWEQAEMTRLSAEVFYRVQGREYSVVLSTLIDETQQE